MDNEVVVVQIGNGTSSAVFITKLVDRYMWETALIVAILSPVRFREDRIEISVPFFQNIQKAGQ